MPRKPVDYSKCMFYRLVCRDPTVKECYVGHTTNEVDRRYSHKSDCHNEKRKQFNYFVYRFIRDHGGWDNWELLVHEKLAVADEHEAALRERHWCDYFKATLNQNVPGRTQIEYDFDHREKKAAWYADHREEKAKINAAYYIAHQKERKQQSAEWALANKEHLKEKHDCPCGGKHTTNGKSEHFKTALHRAYLAKL